jgi:hypothetical protein
LQDFTIQGIKCFDKVELNFPHSGTDYSGWIVLLGGNGMGKSTLLQAMAIALVGPLAGQRLLNPGGWARKGREYGEFEASIIKGMLDLAERRPQRNAFETRFAVTGSAEVVLHNKPYDEPQLVSLPTDSKALMKGPYSAKNLGWFSCGYGPFRRLLGGASADSKQMFAAGRGIRYLTLFREAEALTGCAEWLSTLYSRSIDKQHEDRSRAKTTLDAVRRIVDKLLPGQVRITRVDSERLYFRSVGGADVTILDLSDGYRSFLALAIDVLRHLAGSVKDFAQLIEEENGEPRVVTEGVVLIDEVDAHLHPFWQREIGFRLRRVFPKMQFIVTSHSPFVAQAASDDGLIVLRATTPSGAVEAHRPIESVKGWRADQILTSPLFGLTGTRDEETESLIRLHAELVAKRSWGQLKPVERKRLAGIEKKLAGRLTAPGDSIEERETQAKMANYVAETLDEIGAAR